MGFGFSLFAIIILLPLTVVLLLLSAFTRKIAYAKMTLYIWVVVVALVILVLGYGRLTSQKELSKEDYYGDYVIDRDFFRGEQADWQYNSFRFTITEQDSIYFYLTDKERKLTVYKGSITTVKPYNSERLIIRMNQPTHHILSSNPTIYRSAWSFYMVFESPKFYNVFFKKGKWKPID